MLADEIGKFSENFCFRINRIFKCSDFDFIIIARVYDRHIGVRLQHFMPFARGKICSDLLGRVDMICTSFSVIQPITVNLQVEPILKPR